MKRLTLKDFNLRPTKRNRFYIPPTCEACGDKPRMKITGLDDMEVYYAMQVFIDRFFEHSNVLGALVDKNGIGYMYAPAFNSLTSSEDITKTFKDFVDSMEYEMIIIMQELDDGSFRFIYK